MSAGLAAWAAPRRLTGVALALAAVALVLLRLALALPSQADENIYTYAAFLVTRGALPYRDYFFAHPPLQPLLLAALGAVGGFGPLLARGVAAAAALVALAAVWRVVVAAVGDWAAAVAVLLCAFSYGFMHHSTYEHGLGIAVALAVAGAAMSPSRRPILAGLLFAAALLTRFAALPAVLAALVVAGGDEPRRRSLVLATATALGASGAVLAALALVWGARFWEPVFLYHLAKTSDDAGGPGLWSQLLWEDTALCLVAALGAAAPWLRPVARGERRALASWWREGWRATEGSWRLAAVALPLTALLLGLLATRFPYYLTLVYPFLAIWAAHGLAALGAWLRRAWRDPVRRRWTALAVAAAAAAVWLAQPDGRDPVTRWIANNRRHAFVEVDAIAAFVAAHTRADETLLGDSMQAPLVALRSGRRLAGGEVDLNPQRFRAGFPAPRAFLERALTDRLACVVLLPDARSGDLFAFSEVRELLAREFRAETEIGPFVIYLRRAPEAGGDQ